MHEVKSGTVTVLIGFVIINVPIGKFSKNVELAIPIRAEVHAETEFYESATITIIVIVIDGTSIQPTLAKREPDTTSQTMTAWGRWLRDANRRACCCNHTR